MNKGIYQSNCWSWLSFYAGGDKPVAAFFEAHPDTRQFFQNRIDIGFKGSQSASEVAMSFCKDWLRWYDQKSVTTNTREQRRARWPKIC